MKVYLDGELILDRVDIHSYGEDFGFRTWRGKVHIKDLKINNDRYLLNVARRANIIIAAWGINGNHLNRDKQVISKINRLYHLGLTKGGFPRHPLYLKKDAKPILWIS